jgi:hypothetical protein
MRKKRIFISCGQRLPAEKSFGLKIQQLINESMVGFFAEEAHDAADLNTSLFRELQNCDGFVAVMQKRGKVGYPDSPAHHRASVWVQQEIAILHYRSFLLGRPIPMRIYLESGIEPEGLTQYSMINPIKFQDTQIILEDLAKWLRGSTFDEPPVLVRRENVFRRRVEANDEYDWLILELIAAHCQGPNDVADQVFVGQDFETDLHEKGMAMRQDRLSFDSKLSNLISNGLVHKKNEGGRIFLSIRKQWWELILEELRNRERIK